MSYALSTALGSSRDARQAGSKQATAATRIIVAATPATVDTSVGRTPNNSDAISRLRPKAPASPTTTPILGEDESLPHHAGEHAGSVGAKRHANTDLAAPLRNDGRDDAIRADGGEEQRQAGKEPEQLRQEARPLDGVGKDRFHVTKANDRHGAVYFTDDALDGLRQGRWCEGRAQHDVPEWRNPQPPGAGLATC